MCHDPDIENCDVPPRLTGEGELTISRPGEPPETHSVQVVIPDVPVEALDCTSIQQYSYRLLENLRPPLTDIVRRTCNFNAFVFLHLLERALNPNKLSPALRVESFRGPGPLRAALRGLYDACLALAAHWQIPDLWKGNPTPTPPPLELPEPPRTIAQALETALSALAPLPPPRVEQPEEPKPAARHSTDFRSVHWFGTNFSFTPTQAACVNILWREWENGTPEVGEDTILLDNQVDAESKRLLDIFRGHPAWGAMIVRGATKGAYRLSPPENP
jgi:hypothetical protein